MSAKPDTAAIEVGTESSARSPAAETADPAGEGARATTSGVRTDWFATPVWRFQIAGHQALNEKLLQFVDEERQRNPGGVKGRSSVMGWHSGNQLHRRPEMQDFLAVLHGNVAEVARSYRLDTSQATLKLETCWAMVNGKMASGAIHCHPNSFLSGVYYVSTNEESGNIFFQDPRPGANMAACPVTEYTPLTIRQFSYQPVAGAMLFFPSWLYHGVEPNLSDAPRVSLSFNFRLEWSSGG